MLVQLNSIEGLRTWRDFLVQHQRDLECRGGLTAMYERGELTADPEELALTILAALQGGFQLPQAHHDTRALEVTLDAIIDHVAVHATT